MYDMQAIRKYGQIGSQVFLSWGEHLKNFTDDELKKGLVGALKSESEYAPGLKAFIGYCRNQQTGLTHNTAAYKEFPKNRSLTKKTDRESAKLHIKKISEMLK